MPFIDIEREFDYPVELVFRAHKEPDLFKRWLGPRGYEMDLEQFDFTTGGRYRYVHTVGGESYAFNGVFHVVRDNEFAIQTFEFEGYPDVVSVESIRFEPLEGGRSRLHVHAVYPSTRPWRPATAWSRRVRRKGSPRGTSSWTRCSRVSDLVRRSD